MTIGRDVSTKENSENEHIRALLIEFVDLGRRAKSLKGNPNPIAKNEYVQIVQRICEVATKVVDLSEHMDRSNEYLQIFSAAAVIASAETDDPEAEKCLMALSFKVSKIQRN